jgi:hypothetical protein
LAAVDPCYWYLSQIGVDDGLGGVAMPDYRIYCLDHQGKSVEVHEITASTDEEAIGQARALKGLRQCEVWRGHNLVAKITDFSSVA